MDYAEIAKMHLEIATKYLKEAWDLIKKMDESIGKDILIAMYERLRTQTGGEQ